MPNPEHAPDIYIPESHEAQEPEPFIGWRWLLKRVLVAAAVVGVVVLLIVVPPYVNISRYQRQIATSIGGSLGRPVHMDSVTLKLLPMPGFTIENFVVEEDPAFGAEPVIRADSVRATLRFSSLWHRRVEFSRISLTDPHVNLVHLADGRWNLDSILVQASHIAAAPTAQKNRTLALRFPYIEATGARLNLKMSGEKTPFSLTDAEFALWLPEPNQWHLRLEAHPTRTDTAVSDTGVLHVDGTLGRAGALEAVPVDLSADWTAAPLGAVSTIALGRDMGMRGEMNLAASIRGTVGDHQADAHLQLTGVRRAEFVPARTLNVDLHCVATATGVFHSLSGIACAWPPANGKPESGLAVKGEISDVWNPKSATGELALTDVPASILVDALRVASRQIPSDLTLDGAISGSVTRRDGSNAGTLEIAGERLAWGSRVLSQGDVSGQLAGDRLTLAPIPFDLGAREPATIGITVDPQGYELAVQGNALPSHLKGLITLLGLPPAPVNSSPEAPIAAVAAPVNLRVGGTWAGEPVLLNAPPIKPKRRKR